MTTCDETCTTCRQHAHALRARTLIWAGIVAAGFLLLGAMWLYPGEAGGARRGYSFGENFLSMMGRTKAGAWDNTGSCLLFNGTLIMGGPILAMFWKARAWFLREPGTKALLRGCGLTMGLAMAGIGLSPCDLFPDVHDTMTYAVIVLGVICFGLCLAGSHRGFESAQSKRMWLVILALAGAAQGLFVLFVSMGTIPSRPALPLMQMLFVLMLALWAAWQGVLLGRACRAKLLHRHDTPPQEI